MNSKNVYLWDQIKQKNKIFDQNFVKKLIGKLWMTKEQRNEKFADSEPISTTFDGLQWLTKMKKSENRFFEKWTEKKTEINNDLEQDKNKGELLFDNSSHRSTHSLDLFIQMIFFFYFGKTDALKTHFYG